MMLYCRLLGAVLLVCTGFAAGQAHCQRLWAQWRAVCGFERLLTYLADQLAFFALPSAELLAAAAEHPAFAAYCPPNAASFAELRLPPPLAKTCGAELHAGLHTIALCSRQQAPQTMRTLARNMTFLMRSIALGREKYGLPQREAPIRTNFIK